MPRKNRRPKTQASKQARAIRAARPKKCGVCGHPWHGRQRCSVVSFVEQPIVLAPTVARACCCFEAKR